MEEEMGDAETMEVELASVPAAVESPVSTTRRWRRSLRSCPRRSTRWCSGPAHLRLNNDDTGMGVFGLLHAPRTRRLSTCSSPPSRTCSNTLLRVRVDVIMSIFANVVTHILFGVVVLVLVHSHVGIVTPSWIIHKTCSQFAWLRVEGRLLCAAKAILSPKNRYEQCRCFKSKWSYRPR